MLRRLERDATMADIAAVEALLGARTAEEDPVGHMQFIRRLADLMRRLEEIEAAPYTTAEVALFFGGRRLWALMGFLRSSGRRSSPSFRHWCQARLLRKGVRLGRVDLCRSVIGRNCCLPISRAARLDLSCARQRIHSLSTAP